MLSITSFEDIAISIMPGFYWTHCRSFYIILIMIMIMTDTEAYSITEQLRKIKNSLA